MRSNGLLKWLLIPVVLLVLFIAIRLFSGGSSSAPPAGDPSAQLTPEEMKVLGIEGDTPRDTVATLVAQVKQLRTELQGALSDNKSQREENQRLRQRENAIDQRINSALESERSNLRRDRSLDIHRWSLEDKLRVNCTATHFTLLSYSLNLETRPPL